MEMKESVLTPKAPEISQNAKPPVSNPAVLEKPLVKPLNIKKSNKSTILMILASFLVVALGVTTGWFLAGRSVAVTPGEKTTSQSSNQKEVDQAGIGDPSSYQSNVEGVLKKGGIKGEGTHYIDRGLGESKYVYLTSSVIDLDSFVDKKVQVWGDTISAKYASWLIDVGLIKVVK